MNRPGKKWIGATVIVLVALIIIAAVGVVTLGHKPLMAYAQRALVRVVKERFGSDVEFSSFTISVFPRVHIVGTGLVLRIKGSTDVPPMIQVGKFQLDGNFSQVIRRIPEFETLRLDGLVIQIPPNNTSREVQEPENQTHFPIKFTVDEIYSKDAELYILGPASDKPNLTFDIHELRMKHFQPDGPAPFSATLSNPKPVGEIKTNGQFGPWNVDEPGLTPVKGEFEFSHADLATFHGISGILSSKGKYEGVLQYIAVQGKTETPDFSLEVSGHPLSLNTEYDAVVDGTNGNTTLKSVHVRFLHTSLVASGTIAKDPGAADRVIMLDVYSESARVEDLLHLAVKSSTPVLVGSANLKTKFNLRLHRGLNTFARLEMAGGFGVGGAQFTSKSVQGKINTLSRRGQGEPNSTDDSPAVSELKGEFTLKHGVINFSQLSFSVQGAAIHLAGSYGLEDEALDFHGTLRLQAKLSQTTTGIKSFLLKLVDPMFEKDGAGAVVPILIGGTRTDPSFGVDLHRIKATN